MHNILNKVVKLYCNYLCIMNTKNNNNLRSVIPFKDNLILHRRSTKTVEVHSITQLGTYLRFSVPWTYFRILSVGER